MLQLFQRIELVLYFLSKGLKERKHKTMIESNIFDERRTRVSCTVIFENNLLNLPNIICGFVLSSSRV